ncbi:MAG TPA: sugar phosphate isomerase/epimerase [Candidatus Lokiarchaeia archaeon]|nr:sugar phosphate isomerase/epimerase [Candidatus Lokiarchaeia archaeon]
MKLGVFSVLLGDKPLGEALDILKKLGVEAVEIGTGNYPGDKHCNLTALLGDDTGAEIEAFKREIDDRGLMLSALSCHCNPVHPSKERAEEQQKVQRDTILLAEKLGLDRIVTFSGCPGGSVDDKTPNWVTCPWPDDYLDVLKYQWEEVLIPYWQQEVEFAEAHGVDKICLEMHPGFCVYNPETLLKLREAVGGKVIGANLDPSHLFWQGMDLTHVIRKLNGVIYHFHAKDCIIDPINAATNGVLDTKHYSDEINRSWIFRTCGFGHDTKIWKDIVSNLKMCGYDYVISIEHEDSLASVNEGLSKAVAFLKEVILAEKPGAMTWA